VVEGYPGEFGALAAAGFPDSDPQDAEYFLLFDTAYGRVSSRALPLLKFSDEPADDFTVDGISVDDEPHGSSYMAPSNFFDRLFARTDSGG
jgi:inorganic pyrophosphatase